MDINLKRQIAFITIVFFWISTLSLSYASTTLVNNETNDQVSIMQSQHQSSNSDQMQHHQVNHCNCDHDCTTSQCNTCDQDCSQIHTVPFLTLISSELIISNMIGHTYLPISKNTPLTNHSAIYRPPII